MFSSTRPINGNLHILYDTIISYTPLREASNNERDDKNNNIEERLEQLLTPTLPNNHHYGIQIDNLQVEGNSVYELSLYVEIKDQMKITVKDVALEVNIQSKPAFSNQTYTCSTFNYLVPKKITREYPELQCEIYIPSHIQLILINISLIKENNQFVITQPENESELSVSTNSLSSQNSPPYKDLDLVNTQLYIHVNQCYLKKIANQVLETDVFHSSSNLIHKKKKNVLYNIIDQLYLLQMPWTSSNYTRYFQDQLDTLKLYPQLIHPLNYKRDSHDVVTNQLPHSYQTCNGCHYRFMKEGYNNYHPQKSSLMECQQIMIEMWIYTLQTAISEGKNTIMIVSDDSVVHQDWYDQIQLHTENLPQEEWQYILLGANHAKTGNDNNNNNNKQYGSELFYTVTGENIHSNFAVILSGKGFILSLLHFLIEKNGYNAKEPRTNWEKIFDLYDFQQEKKNHTIGYVFYPNLFIPHPKHSLLQNLLISPYKDYTTRLSNYNSNHVLYWNYKEYYLLETEEPVQNTHDLINNFAVNHSLPSVKPHIIYCFLFLDWTLEVNNSGPNGTVSNLFSKLDKIYDDLQQQTYPFIFLSIFVKTTQKNLSELQSWVNQKQKQKARILIYYISANQPTLTQIQGIICNLDMKNSDFMTWQSLTNLSSSWRFSLCVESWYGRNPEKNEERTRFLVGLQSKNNQCNINNHGNYDPCTLFGSIHDFKYIFSLILQQHSQHSKQQMYDLLPFVYKHLVEEHQLTYLAIYMTTLIK